MLHSVFFALMVGSPTHPPLLAQDQLPPPTAPASALPPPTPPPPSRSRNAPSACASVQSALPPPLCKHSLLEAACLAAHALPPGRGMDLNPELLSASDRMCVGLVVQCMFQCRVHNLNTSSIIVVRSCWLWSRRGQDEGPQARVGLGHPTSIHSKRFNVHCTSIRVSFRWGCVDI